MGKSCYLCRMVFQKGDTKRSFHRFPDPQYQREAWCQSLRLDINKVSGWMCICSDHFDPESFNYKLNGTRFLKDDAVPLFYDGPVRKRKTRYSRSKKIKQEAAEAECEKQEYENKEFDSHNDFKEYNKVFIKTEDWEESTSDNVTKTKPPLSTPTKTEKIVVKTEITEEYIIKDEDIFTNIKLEAKNESILKPCTISPPRSPPELKLKNEDTPPNVELEAKKEGIIKPSTIAPPNFELEAKKEDILKPFTISPPNVELEAKNEGIIKPFTIAPPNFELKARNKGILKPFTLSQPNVVFELESENEGILKPFELSDEFECQNGDYSETSETNEISECEEEAREELEDLTYMGRTKLSKLANDPLAMRFKMAYPRPRDTNLYKCVECPFTTPSRTIIRRHFMGHRDAEFKKNPERYRYKTLHCQECSYVTIQKNNLTRHMVKHQSLHGPQVKVYSCNECGYFTKYRCDLVRHQTKHVNVEHRFKCTKCSYGTNEGKHLREHLLKGHIEGKKYKYECEKCPYKTDCRGSLNRHIRESHSENRKFKYECQYCSFKIDSKWSWNKHMKGHAEISLAPQQSILASKN